MNLDADPHVNLGTRGPTPALDTLASIRSRQAAEMLALLADYGTALNVTPWTWPHSGAPILVSEVFVDLDVLKQTREPEPMTVRPSVRTVDGTDAARYELPTNVQDPDRVRWSRLPSSGDCRVLKGPPGSGKSFLSRYTAVERLRRAHRELEDRRVPLANLPVTVWVTASALAAVDQRSSLTGTLVLAAANSLDMDAATRDRFRWWLDNGLMNRNALVIVDGLDEVQPENIEACRRRLAQITGLPGHLLLTCRTLHWEFLKGELLPPLAAEEFELAPLASTQLQQLVHRLFADESDRGAHVHVALEQNPGLRHACTTPLRLLFVCLLARDGRVTSATTYAGLYTHLLRALVEGRWRTHRPRWVSRPLQVEQVLEALIGIGWELFVSAPANNRFTLTEWTTAARTGSGRRASNERLLEDLVALGLVVPAGFTRMGDRCWSFAHRTILEYLAARNLAARPTHEWLAIASTHIWFEPEWSEVLTFLASAVPDASPLIRVVDREADDIFGSMLELRARLAGVARHVSMARVQRIVHEALGLALSDNGLVPGRVERSLRALGWSRLGPLLVELRRCPGEWPQQVIIDAIGGLGPGEPVVHLLDALRSDLDESVRAAAAIALGKTGSSESIPIVVQAMHDDPSERVRRACAEALGRLGDESVLAVISTAFHDDPDRNVRRAAAEAILALAGPEHIDYLMDALSVDEMPTRQRIATRLGELGAMMAVAPLARALLPDERVDDDEHLRDEFNAATRARRAAVKALGTLGGRDAADILRQVMLEDESPPVRRAASGALRTLIGDEAFTAIVAPLVNTLRDDTDPIRRRGSAAAVAGYTAAFDALTRALETDPDEDVRREAVYGLAPFFEGRESFSPLPLLTHALRADPDPDVRSAIVHALWKNRNAAPALADALRGDPNDTVRYQAAFALASSGDPIGLPALLAATDDEPVSFVRDGAAKAIVEHMAPGLLEPLIETLLASRASTAAAYALGRRGVPRSVHPIRDGKVASLAWSGAAAIALNRLGLRCRDADRLGLARTLVHSAMSWDRRTRGRRHQKVAHRLLNLAGVELMRSGPDRARKLLVRAWASCARSADLTTARILALRLIVASMRGESLSTYLGQLKTILVEGALSNVADVDQERFAAPVLTFAEPYLTHEHRLLVTAITDVLKGASPRSTLSELEIFASQPALPLGQRWETPDRAAN
jgi:HEAT repeat protein